MEWPEMGMKSETVDCGAESCVIRLEMGGKCETDRDGRPDLDVRPTYLMGLSVDTRPV